MKNLGISERVLEKYYKNELPPAEALQVERGLMEQRSLKYSQMEVTKALLAEHLKVHPFDSEAPILEMFNYKDGIINIQNIENQSIIGEIAPKEMEQKPSRYTVSKVLIRRMAATLILPALFTPIYMHSWKDVPNPTKMNLEMTDTPKNRLEIAIPAKKEVLPAQEMPSPLNQTAKIALFKKEKKPDKTKQNINEKKHVNVTNSSSIIYKVDVPVEPSSNSVETYGVLAGKELPMLTTSIHVQIKANVDSLLNRCIFLEIGESSGALKESRMAFNLALESFKSGQSAFGDANFFQYMQDLKQWAVTADDKYILALCYARNDLYDTAMALLEDILTQPLPSAISKEHVEALLKLMR